MSPRRRTTDEAKTTRAQNRDQGCARAEGGEARSAIGQISETGPRGRRPGKSALVDQGAPGNTALRNQSALEPRTVRRSAQYADQARTHPEGERWFGDAILSGLTGRPAISGCNPRLICVTQIPDASALHPDQTALSAVIFPPHAFWGNGQIA